MERSAALASEPRYSKRMRLRVGVVLLLLAPVVASAQAPARLPPADPAAVETTLFLIGDGGKPAIRGEPVLRALGADLLRDPARSLAVFLGDNLYPEGLPETGDPRRAEMERRLDDQVAAVKSAGARGIFIPGNHDWEQEKPGGWEAVRRQQRRVDERGAPLVAHLPKDGCPGPEVMDVGARLRLVFLDTQWWLQPGPKPMDPTSTCAADSPEEVLGALRHALETAGDRHVVVLAHHPLRSGGPHGGHFTFRQHVFPLTDAKKWLWLPLPGIGSIYPVARGKGKSPQDHANKVNRRMREAFEGVLREQPPLVWASGHEHVQEVLTGTSARTLLVSGGGIYGHESPVRPVEGTRYASSHAGYMRLDVLRDGRVRLGVEIVDKKGAGREAHAEWLVP